MIIPRRFAEPTKKPDQNGPARSFDFNFQLSAFDLSQHPPHALMTPSRSSISTTPLPVTSPGTLPGTPLAG
jgi:hypothetical protein